MPKKNLLNLIEQLPNDKIIDAELYLQSLIPIPAEQPNHESSQVSRYMRILGSKRNLTVEQPELTTHQKPQIEKPLLQDDLWEQIKLEVAKD